MLESDHKGKENAEVRMVWRKTRGGVEAKETQGEGKDALENSYWDEVLKQVSKLSIQMEECKYNQQPRMLTLPYLTFQYFV